MHRVCFSSSSWRSPSQQRCVRDVQSERELITCFEEVPTHYQRHGWDCSSAVCRKGSI
jgi:hypothetical protein